jgi:hypothetical protein
MSDVAALQVELEALRARIGELELLKPRFIDLEARLTARIAAEEEIRKAEVGALREEWRNISQAIAASSTAMANATTRILAEFTEIRETQRFQLDQLKLFGQAMEMLLQTEGLEMPR